MSHLHMSVMGASSSVDYYPDQSAASSTTLYHATTVLGDSDFPADGSEDAIIYSLTLTIAASSGRLLTVSDRAGEVVIRTSGSGSAPQCCDFGPEGLRVPGGFVVRAGTGVANATIVYDRVSSNA